MRVVSMPSWELFEPSRRLPRRGAAAAGPRALAVEAGVPQGWHRYVGDRGDMLGIERFGASAPGTSA